MMMALARRIVSGEEEDESEAEELLVDNGWKVVEVEPEAAPVNGNGHHANGNGHETIGIGPTVELVLGNGHHPNGNGHHDEAPEPQQSLFSWAEFMAEEPVKPRGRGARPRPRHCPCSSGHWKWSRRARRSRSARGARPQHTGGGRRYVSDGLPSFIHVCGLFLLSGIREPPCSRFEMERRIDDRNPQSYTFIVNDRFS